MNKSILFYVSTIFHVFFSCTISSESYLDLPQVKTVYKIDYKDFLDVNKHTYNYFYDKRGLLIEISGTDSILDNTIKWDIRRICQKMLYNKSQNISSIIYYDTKNIAITNFVYDENDKIKYSICRWANSIDTINYEHEGNKTILKRKDNSYLHLEYLTDGDCDSIYTFQGKYIVAKKFYEHSEKIDKSKYPEKMLNPLHPKCMEVIKIKSRSIGNIPDPLILEYNYDTENRQIRSLSRNCGSVYVAYTNYY